MFSDADVLSLMRFIDERALGSIPVRDARNAFVKAAEVSSDVEFVRIKAAKKVGTRPVTVWVPCGCRLGAV